MHQPRIVVNARFLTQPISGVQTYGLALANALMQSNIPVEFWVPGGATRNIPFDGPVQAIGNTQGVQWEQFTLPRALKKQGAPLLISPGNTGPVYYKNQILVVHDLFVIQRPSDYSWAFRNWYRWAWHRLIPNVHQIVTVSKTSQQHIQQHFRTRSPIPYIHWGFDAPHFEEQPRSTILGIGSNNPRKNSQLTRALQAEFTAHKWVLMGQPSGVYAQSDNPRAALTFDALYQHYQQAQLIVLPSYDEGFGISCVEAMAMGCVVVCSDIPAHREVCGNAAHYVSGFAYSDWQEALADVLANPDLMTRLRQAGFARAQQFTSRVFRQNWRNVLASIV